MKTVYVNDVLEILHKYGKFIFVTDTERYSEMVNEISNLTSADPKTAYWIEEKINEWSRKTYCSKCGESAPFEYVHVGDTYYGSAKGVIKKTNYCPNCGARMVKSQERG